MPGFIFLSDVMNLGGGGSNNKKDEAGGKTQDVLCLFCSFLLFLLKCPQTENKKVHAAEKIARCPFYFFFVVGPPPPPGPLFLSTSISYGIFWEGSKFH